MNCRASAWVEKVVIKVEVGVGIGWGARWLNGVLRCDDMRCVEMIVLEDQARKLANLAA